MNVLDINKVLGVVHRRCLSNNVTLEFTSKVTVPCTNGKAILIPPFNDPTDEDMTKLHGFVVHECGHHSRPKVFDIANSSGASQEQLLLYNITEDDGMERDVARKYQGDAVALGKMNRIIMDRVAKQVQEHPISKDPQTIDQMAPGACLALGQLSRVQWDKHSNSVRHKYLNSLHPDTTKLIEELVNEGYVEKMQATKDEHDTWDVACDLYKRLYPNKETETEEARGKGHGMKGPKGEGDGKPDDAKAGKGRDGKPKGCKTGDSEGKQQEAKGNKCEGDPDAEGGSIRWQDAVLSDHVYTKQDGLPGNTGIDWSGIDTTGQVARPMPPFLVNVVDCTKGKNPVDYAGCLTLPQSRVRSEHLVSDDAGNRAFASQVRRYVQATQRTKKHNEQYEGRLDKNSLSKLALPPVDGGEWNKRLFYKMDKRKRKDTALCVLVDWSGSMRGTKKALAADAAGRLVDVFNRVLHVPTMVAAFSNKDTQCDVGLLKRFNERSTNKEDLAESFCKFDYFSSCNNDADAVLWAHAQLLKRKEQRKMLIVISDGHPVGAWAADETVMYQQVRKEQGHVNLIKAADDIQKAGLVELYGVGIKSNAVKNYYKQYKVVNKVEQINNVLFTIIKEGILR